MKPKTEGIAATLTAAVAGTILFQGHPPEHALSQMVTAPNRAHLPHPQEEDVSQKIIEPVVARVSSKGHYFSPTYFSKQWFSPDYFA